MLCITNGDSRENKASSCPSQNEAKGVTDTQRGRKFLDLIYFLYAKKYGDPEDWADEKFNDMTLERIPSTLLLRVEDNMLQKRKVDLATVSTAGSLLWLATSGLSLYKELCERNL